MKTYKDWICRYYSEHEDGEPDGEIIQELIRCKDCKHYTKEGHVRCWNPHGMHPTDPDDYCSRAERKEE